MNKTLILLGCGILLALLVFRSPATQKDSYYMVDGEIYKCEELKYGGLTSKIRYFDGEKWVYETVFNSDIIYLEEDKVK